MSDFDFVMRCINSCVNEWQLKTCMNIIRRFIEKYKDRELEGVLLDQIIAQQSKLL